MTLLKSSLKYFFEENLIIFTRLKWESLQFLKEHSEELQEISGLQILR
jgi:hypothetical protein